MTIVSMGRGVEWSYFLLVTLPPEKYVVLDIIEQMRKKQYIYIYIWKYL